MALVGLWPCSVEVGTLTYGLASVALVGLGPVLLRVGTLTLMDWPLALFVEGWDPVLLWVGLWPCSVDGWDPVFLWAGLWPCSVEGCDPGLGCWP